MGWRAGLDGEIRLCSRRQLGTKSTTTGHTPGACRLSKVGTRACTQTPARPLWARTWLGSQSPLSPAAQGKASGRKTSCTRARAPPSASARPSDPPLVADGLGRTAEPGSSPFAAWQPRRWLPFKRRNHTSSPSDWWDPQLPCPRREESD